MPGLSPLHSCPLEATSQEAAISSRYYLHTIKYNQHEKLQIQSQDIDTHICVLVYVCVRPFEVRKRMSLSASGPVSLNLLSLPVPSLLSRYYYSDLLRMIIKIHCNPAILILFMLQHRSEERQVSILLLAKYIKR